MCDEHEHSSASNQQTLFYEFEKWPTQNYNRISIKNGTGAAVMLHHFLCNLVALISSVDANRKLIIHPLLLQKQFGNSLIKFTNVLHDYGRKQGTVPHGAISIHHRLTTASHRSQVKVQEKGRLKTSSVSCSRQLEEDNEIFV